MLVSDWLFVVVGDITTKTKHRGGLGGIEKKRAIRIYVIDLAFSRSSVDFLPFNR